MLKKAINSGLRVSGGIGLFFSFTEVSGDSSGEPITDRRAESDNQSALTGRFIRPL